MKPEIQQQLLNINAQFYTEFGRAFSATRKRIQPGTRHILNSLPNDHTQNWIDMGCGSGALGVEWAAAGRTGSYLGIDFSEPLLNEARLATVGLNDDRLSLDYQTSDLMDPSWADEYQDSAFDGVMAFASLHHIPGHENHQRIFRQARRILTDDGLFILSVWQFQNSEKLLSLVVPWSQAGIDPSDLEEGDTLLDWRYSLPENQSAQGLRYVHLFTPDELSHLATNSGFIVQNHFLSDGSTSNLAYYLILSKK